MTVHYLLINGLGEKIELQQDRNVGSISVEILKLDRPSVVQSLCVCEHIGLPPHTSVHIVFPST